MLKSEVDNLLERALSAVLAGDQALRDALDELPAAIYVADADGVVTFFNLACRTLPEPFAALPTEHRLSTI